jgi:hypothetical protein
MSLRIVPTKLSLATLTLVAMAGSPLPLVAGDAARFGGWASQILPAERDEPSFAPSPFLPGHGLAPAKPAEPPALRNTPVRVGYRPDEAVRPDAGPRAETTRLVQLAAAPFPYEGNIATSNASFVNVNENGRLGHRSRGGRIHWVDETYADSRVLLHIPKSFDITRPGLIVLFFHGHRATLARDVLQRQRVAEQVTRSGANAVLVAPQLAHDAADSSPGKLWQPGGCKRLLDEAASQLGNLYGGGEAARTFARMPVVMIGYSGGFLPVATCLQNGKIGARLRGVVLLDGLYGQLGTFEQWLTHNRSAFFVSSFTSSTARRNLELKHFLDQRLLTADSAMPERLGKGSIAFLGTTDKRHRDFVTNAWTDDPIADLLRRTPVLAR